MNEQTFFYSDIIGIVRHIESNPDILKFKIQGHSEMIPVELKKENFHLFKHYICLGHVSKK